MMAQGPVLFWYWWCLALALAALEMFIPGAAFLWIAGAAALVGLAAWVVPSLGLAGELLLFGLLATAGVLASRRFFPRDAADHQADTLNRRGEQYIGRVVTLVSAIEDGRGRAQVGDTQWAVAADQDFPAGTRVRIVAVDGAMLKVSEIDTGSGA